MAHHPNGLKADYTIATVSVTLVLLLLGAVGYILLNAYSSTSAVRSELRFSLLLSDTVTHAQRAAIERRMGLHPAIASWRIGADFVEFLGENPLPASYELTLNAGHTDPSDLTALERECTTWSGVEEVAYQQKIIDAVTRNLNRLNYILLGLGIFLLAVAIMLISNTLRLAVAARRQAIATMKLVGATTAFIRRPFVWRSFTQGVVAGVLSSLLLYLFADGLSEVMPDIRLSTDRSTLALLFSGMILVGVTICTTFTALAVNRFVRRTD